MKVIKPLSHPPLRRKLIVLPMKVTYPSPKGEVRRGLPPQEVRRGLRTTFGPL
jgi:hypothetical protein